MLKRVRKRKQEKPNPEKPKRGETKRFFIAQQRARKVLSLVNENPGMGIGSAMLQVGYAPITAHTPSNLTKSKVWLDLLDEYLPRNEVLEAHRGLLKASQVESVTFESPSENFTDEHIARLFDARGCTVMRTVRRTDNGVAKVIVYFWSPDSRARKDGLEMAYKLRGDYAPEKHLHAHFSLLALGKPEDAPLLPEPSQVPRIEDIEA